MPVEIRELVIQAKLTEDTPSEQTFQREEIGGSSSSSQSGDDESSEEKNDAGMIDEEKIELIVEKCVARMQEWLSEKNLR
jgi:NACalpha-BTF3-like transcription factor